ncbi:hypothetical protein PROP_00322 [Propionicimonas sp. T2.31MG-18]|uniref:arsenate reductase/protein-tyrosine-phosphatase family protein n=1 Tax=Propionicimonas sp. T2.31MG-18 TaxID=3157620 RepID=UPI0035EBEA8B
MWGTAGGIFLVCTANICRSVYGSAILADALSGTSITVGSAGVETVEGQETCPVVRGLVSVEGLPQPPQLTTGSRELVVEELAEAALILTFTVRQRGLVARLDPSTRDRLFTLREASTLAAAIRGRRLDPGGLPAWAHALHSNRPILSTLAPPPPPPRRWWQFRRPPEAPEPWDLPDAHSAPEELHAARLGEVAELCRRLGVILAGAHG